MLTRPCYRSNNFVSMPLCVIFLCFKMKRNIPMNDREKARLITRNPLQNRYKAAHIAFEYCIFIIVKIFCSSVVTNPLKA